MIFFLFALQTLFRRYFTVSIISRNVLGIKRVHPEWSKQAVTQVWHLSAPRGGRHIEVRKLIFLIYNLGLFKKYVTQKFKLLDLRSLPPLLSLWALHIFSRKSMIVRRGRKGLESRTSKVHVKFFGLNKREGGGKIGEGHYKNLGLFVTYFLNSA